jgi:hypothetical protein
MLMYFKLSSKFTKNSDRDCHYRILAGLLVFVGGLHGLFSSGQMDIILIHQNGA